MDSPQDPSDLKSRIAALNDQVKLLVKTEKRLHATQRELEKQLQRIDALNRFSLRAPSASLDHEIMGGAVELLSASIPITGALTLLREPQGKLAVYLWRDHAFAPLAEAEYADVNEAVDETNLSAICEELTILPGEPRADGLPILEWLERVCPGLEEGMARAQRSVFLMSMPGTSEKARDYIICRSETDSYYEQVAGDADLPFLTLTYQHLLAAISMARSRRHLETRVEERTQQLAEANAELERRLKELRATHGQLIQASRLAGMADVATSVLHNVGNVLTSVIVSADLVRSLVRSAKGASLQQAVNLLDVQPDPARFLTTDPRGQRLIPYFGALATALQDDQRRILAELDSLVGSIEHIKAIVGMQQSHSRSSGMIEQFPASAVIDDVLRLNAVGLGGRGPQIQRDEIPGLVVESDRHKVLIILMNLLSNARHATKGKGDEARITIATRQAGADQLIFEVEDNGVGIPAENLDRIFSHGFTTKRDGHGFGLHSSACAAIELGGKLCVFSAGESRGARFTLVLPTKPLGRAKVAPAGPPA